LLCMDSQLGTNKWGPNEKDWLRSLTDWNPELGAIWGNYDDVVKNSLQVQKDAIKKLGLDSSHIDAFPKEHDQKL
jgi:hypothetical protein